MTTTQLNELADRVHQLAKDKGWHSFDESVDEFITRCGNNAHGEISELWEAHRAGKLNQPCDKAEKMVTLGIKPLTCAEEECADIVIRDLDSCRRRRVLVRLEDSGANIVPFDSVPQAVDQLHDQVRMVRRFFYNSTYHSILISFCVATAKLLEFDLWSAVERKHQYNATREYRHGGKVA